MSEPFILNFTPTGMIPTKDMTPHVPLSPAEIAEQVLEVAELGVNMVHLHARDAETNRPTYRKEVYAEIISHIRRHNRDLILGASTSGRDFSAFAQRSDCLDLKGDCKPDFGSLTLSSLNFSKTASCNAPDMIQSLVNKMRENGIRPELEVFDLGMANYANYLIKKGLIEAPFYFNLIFGNIASAQANMLSMGLIANELPDGALWAAGGLGDQQLTANAVALAAGGGVRIGLEDNIWLDQERTRLATNKDLVLRVLELAKTLGRAPFSQKEARQRLCEC